MLCCELAIRHLPYPLATVRTQPIDRRFIWKYHPLPVFYRPVLILQSEFISVFDVSRNKSRPLPLHHHLQTSCFSTFRTVRLVMFVSMTLWSSGWSWVAVSTFLEVTKRSSLRLPRGVQWLKMFQCLCLVPIIDNILANRLNEANWYSIIYSQSFRLSKDISNIWLSFQSVEISTNLWCSIIETIFLLLLMVI